MHLFPRTCAAFSALLVLACAGLAADTGGVAVNSGDSLTAEITAGDTDAFAFDLLEGGTFSVKVKGVGGLRPSLEVVHPSGLVEDVRGLVKGAGKPSVKLLKFAAPPGESGRFVVRIGGETGSAGAYKATFTVSQPVKSTGSALLVPVEGQTFRFGGNSGATAKVTITDVTGPPVASARLLDPAAAEIPDSGAAFVRKKKKLSAAVPLAQGFGRYALEMLGTGPEPSVANVSVSVKFAAVAKRKATLGPEPTAAPPSPAVKARQEATGLVLALTTQNLPADSQASVAGDGVTLVSAVFDGAGTATLTLDVAADAPYGPRDVVLCPPALLGEPFTLAAAFTVVAPDPTITDVFPGFSQGSSPDVVFLNGTGLRPGGTIELTGGTGVAITSVEYVSPTRYRIVAATDVDAPLGRRTVTYRHAAEAGGAEVTLADGAGVFGPAPSVTAVAPALVRQATSGTLVTVTGTNFLDGGTISVSGAGFTLTNPTRIDGSTYQATLTVAADAAFGQHDVTYTHSALAGGASGTKTGALTVLAPVPTIASLSPPAVKQKDQNVTLTLTGTGFRAGGLFQIAGQGLTVGPTVVVDDTTATTTVSVSEFAQAGTRDVRFTQPAAGGGDQVTVTALMGLHFPVPTITSVSPSAIGRGVTGAFTLTGLDLRDGGAATTDGTGVTLGTPEFISYTEYSVPYTVDAGAPVGFHSLTFSQYALAGGASTTVTNAFEVRSSSPTFTSIDPSAWLPSSPHIAVRVVGTQFNPGTVVSLTGNGITVHSTTVVSETELSADVSVSSAANFGPRNLVITPGPSGGGSGVFVGAVNVVPADPELRAISVPIIAQGISTYPVTLTGTNFRPGDTVFSSGAGVTFTQVTYSQSVRMTALVTVAPNATLGFHDVTVMHDPSYGGRSKTKPRALRVVGVQPAVNGVNPSAIAATASGGPTRDVPITITGANFMTGATLTVSKGGGTGVAVRTGSETVVSDLTMTAVLTVAPAATAGAWDLLVVNPLNVGNSGATGLAALAIRSSSVLTVNDVSPASGSAYGGEYVTVHGGGFSAGDVVEFGSVRGRGTQVLDASTLVTTVPPPSAASNAAATPVDVTVRTAGGSTATLTAGYTYAADDVSFRVKRMVPAHGATGVATNLRRVALLLTAPCDASSGAHGTDPAANSLWSAPGGSAVSTARGFAGGDRWLVLSGNSGGSLASGTYTANVPTSLRSKGGTPLAPVRSNSATSDQYTFTVASGTTDSTAPTVTSVVPGNGTTGADPAGRVTLLFGEPLDPLTVNATNITFTQGATPVAAAIEVSDDLRTVTVIPDTELLANTSYITTVTTGVRDLASNAFAATTGYTFTTAASDTVAPVVGVVLEDLPSDVDGSGTCVSNSGTSNTAFDAFLPRARFELDVRWSDAGGSGIDEATFSAKCSASIGATPANTELASNFTVTPVGAVWRVPLATLVTPGENVTFTFGVRDRAGNTSAAHTITVDVVDQDALAVGSTSVPGGHTLGDHEPLDARRVVVLRFDLDAYTSTFSTQASPAKQGVTTTVAGNGVPDFEESLRLVGLNTASMTAAAAAAQNGTDRGTNAIVARLVMHRTRDLLRARYSIGQDGTYGADSPDIEFLLPGEQGALANPPVYNTANAVNAGGSFSEMSVGGTPMAESNAFSVNGSLGLGWYDARNVFEEANLNFGTSAAQTSGVYLTSLLKTVVNDEERFKSRVSTKFLAVHGGTPVGTGTDDPVVLADTFDRTSGANSAAQNQRYDAIRDAVEEVALLASARLAHEIGHSTGVLADNPPKTGFFGAAHYSNTFTEATSATPNAANHLDFTGNDLMGGVRAYAYDVLTGTEFARFDPLSIAYLRNRLCHDEGR